MISFLNAEFRSLETIIHAGRFEKAFAAGFSVQINHHGALVPHFRIRNTAQIKKAD